MLRSGWTPLVVFALLAACQASDTLPDGTDPIREITVLYTNDEHGWMEGMEPGTGAANLYRVWQQQEGFTRDGPFLLLSGGDNWTGPAISTWVQGESMVEVMNAMDYDASAVGNHEFDFGLEILKQRAAEAEFPYLSANTRWKDSGQIPVELGILPYTIKEVNGLEVAIVGLTTTSTPRTANPQFVRELRFEDYEQALRTAVAEVRTADPDLLFVIAHVCMVQLEALALSVSDLDIDLMGGGHCNELVARRVGETVLLGGGYHFTSYARAHIRYDVRNDQLVDMEFGVAVNVPVNDDPVIASIVERWQGQFSDSLTQVIAWSDREIDFRTAEFRQAVIDSWLVSDPSADFAITNAGGLRTPLPAGEITLNDLVNVMPFENNVFAVNIPGRVVVEAIESGGRPIVAGLIRRGDDYVVTRTGTVIDDDQLYRVLVNSFMYAGGDNFQVISENDPNGYDTGIHYRQPFVDALRQLQTAPSNPVDLQDLIQTR
jgi:2',3'-cyclic-nucleotide 2'-phosphodiesterase (5'-nucleotidase family)